MEALSAQMQKSNVYPPEMWEIGKKNGFFRCSLPTQYGGMGLCLEQFFTVLEEVFGGIAYFKDNPYGPMERPYRDARAM